MNFDPKKAMELAEFIITSHPDSPSRLELASYLKEALILMDRYQKCLEAAGMWRHGRPSIPLEMAEKAGLVPPYSEDDKNL